MTIETMFVALLCMMFVMLVFIARLCFKIDDLKNELLCYNKRLMTIQDKADKIGLCISDLHDDVRDASTTLEGSVNIIQRTLDDLIEEDYEEDEPEEEEDLPTNPLGELADAAVKFSVEVDELPIHLITPNQYLFEAGYDKFELEYSETSDILVYYYGTDEDSWENIVIDNVTECVGDALKFFGVNAKDDRHVYVRNNIFHADFRIVKVN